MSKETDNIAVCVIGVRGGVVVLEEAVEEVEGVLILRCIVLYGMEFVLYGIVWYYMVVYCMVLCCVVSLQVEGVLSLDMIDPPLKWIGGCFGLCLQARKGDTCFTDSAERVEYGSYGPCR